MLATRLHALWGFVKKKLNHHFVKKSRKRNQTATHYKNNSLRWSSFFSLNLLCTTLFHTNFDPPHPSQGIVRRKLQCKSTHSAHGTRLRVLTGRKWGVKTTTRNFYSTHRRMNCRRFIFLSRAPQFLTGWKKCAYPTCHLWVLKNNGFWFRRLTFRLWIWPFKKNPLLKLYFCSLS